jgi:TPR repeat protein
MPMRTPLLLVLLLVLAGAQAQTPRPIDRAVALYEQGDHAGAKAAFERLSRAGVAAADYNLGLMHLRCELPQARPAEAERLLQRAAGRGFVTAQFALGRFYEEGAFNGARDLGAAQRWYLVAAQSGSVDAQVAVGTAHYLGRGAARDLGRAAYWFREAAKGGDVGAQYLLASMYETGHGLTRDLRQARYWYDIAARNGDEAAPDKVKQLDAQAGAAARPPGRSEGRAAPSGGSEHSERGGSPRAPP